MLCFEVVVSADGGSLLHTTQTYIQSFKSPKCQNFSFEARGVKRLNLEGELR